MIIEFSSPSLRLHGWIYEIVAAVTYDRDYVYRSFYRVLQQLLGQVLEKGHAVAGGTVWIYGLKSDWDVRLHYRMQHRLNHIGLNPLHCTCEVVDKRSGAVLESCVKSFELSCGDAVEDCLLPPAAIRCN